MFEKFANEHWSGRKLYHWLKFDLNFRSVTSNKPLTLSNIYLLLQTPLYYGIFEYPKGSGNFYTGKHQPIISRELYEAAQKQLKRDQIVRGESKEFAFTRLITCGYCGSGVCAQEKFKEIKSTKTTARYVYYGCSRSKDLHCKNKYLREEELIEQLIGLTQEMDFDESEIRKRFDEEVKRHTKFQRSFLGAKQISEEEVFDAAKYATYVLREGSPGEKRELLGAVKSRIILKDKIIIKE
jgi:hypothetical protein